MHRHSTIKVIWFSENSSHIYANIHRSRVLFLVSRHLALSHFKEAQLTVQSLSNEPSGEHTHADCAAVTFHGDVDPRGQEQASEAVVEDLVSLQRGRSVVRDFDA